MNPGSPTPQAGILNQYRRHTPSILYNEVECEPLAIRRPQQDFKYKNEILKTITKAKTEGKADNTLRSFYFRLKELSKVSDLMKTEDVKQAIAYAKLTNSSKCSFALAYEWFTKANGLQWDKPKFKWVLPTPIMPTTSQVEKIISATTPKFATIFKLMAEIGVEGEELHQTHRKQFEQTQGIARAR